MTDRADRRGHPAVDPGIDPAEQHEGLVQREIGALEQRAPSPRSPAGPRRARPDDARAVPPLAHRLERRPDVVRQGPTGLDVQRPRGGELAHG